MNGQILQNARRTMSDEGPTDQRLRKRFFWAIFLGGAGFILVGYYAESRLSFLITNKDKAGRSKSYNPYGSYGFSLARIPDRSAGSRKIVCLGNSVYQSCGIVERMQAKADDSREDIDFVNLAQTGAGFYDHLAQMGKVVQHKPDLVVVAFINLAFTNDYGYYDALPNFRTDADQVLFDSDVVSVLPASFYRRELSPRLACELAISSLVRIRRVDTILLHKTEREIGKSLPQWYRQQFAPPGLNLAAEWSNRLSALPKRSIDSPRAYPHSDRLIAEFLDCAAECDVPVLFIRQAAGPVFQKPDMWPLIVEACASRRQAFAADFQHLYSAEEIPDQVHPAGDSARAYYADCHFDVICRTLKELAMMKKKGAD